MTRKPPLKDDDMSPEVADAIRIADKHLSGLPAARREALAKEIVQAIIRHAEIIALDAIKIATNTKQH